MPPFRSYVPQFRAFVHKDSHDSLIAFLLGCLAGVVVGAAVGILMAPHRGDITRRKLVRRAGETRDQVVEKVEDLMVHRSDERDDVDEAAHR